MIWYPGGLSAGDLILRSSNRKAHTLHPLLLNVPLHLRSVKWWRRDEAQRLISGWKWQISQEKMFNAALRFMSDFLSLSSSFLRLSPPSNIPLFRSRHSFRVGGDQVCSGRGGFSAWLSKMSGWEFKEVRRRCVTVAWEGSSMHLHCSIRGSEGLGTTWLTSSSHPM